MYCAIDTETTGIEPGSRMVELAAVLFDETGVKGRFEGLVNPGMPMPHDTTEMNGITDDMLEDEALAVTVLSAFSLWLPRPIDEITMIAHYARFDTGILNWEIGRYWGADRTVCDWWDDGRIIDTWEIAKVDGQTKDNKLDTLVEHYRIQRIGEGHRAASDADACMQYFRLMQRGGDVDLDRYARPWDEAGHDYAYTAELPFWLSSLPALVERGELMLFEYDDGKGDRTERTITPYGWAVKNDVLYFHGWCHLRNARRTFRADRVVL